MGFWSSVGSSILNMNYGKDEIEDNATHQKYLQEIHRFNINQQQPNNVQEPIELMLKSESEHMRLNNINTIEDVKKYFEQQENKE